MAVKVCWSVFNNSMMGNSDKEFIYDTATDWIIDGNETLWIKTVDNTMLASFARGKWDSVHLA